MDESSMIEKRGRLAYLSPQEDSRIILVGDIHGDLDALKRAISMRRPRDILIFLGDYADRGPDGVEVIEGIDMLLQKHPDAVVALMGNHEEYDDSGRPSFSPCTLMYEADQKRGGWQEFFESTFKGFLGRLSLAAVLPGGALFLHGGLGNGIEVTASLEEPDASMERNVLWSDPSPERGVSPNMRGAGKYFGPDISESTMRNLDVHHVFRSHEPRKATGGPVPEHDGRIVTVSSTRVYGGRPFLLSLVPAQLLNGMSVEELNESTVFLDTDL
jgi:serine/threonine-protein phosphatase PP1 catalytic subunit